VKATRAAAVVLTAASFLLVGCGSSSSESAATEGSGDGCGASTSAGAIRVSFTVARSLGHPVPIVSVCLEGKGPYPFVLSSGAGTSSVVPSLATSLHLIAASSQGQVLGVSCIPNAPTVSVRSWSMAGVKLTAQKLQVASLPGEITPRPLGLIGSDVLARFGAVRVDFRAHELQTSGPEGAAPTSSSLVIGQTSTVPTPGLVHGTPRAGSPVTVLIGPTGTLMSVPVSLGSSSSSWTVDTGSPNSVVAPGTASSAGLTPTGSSAPSWGRGCTGTVPQVASGTWSVNDAALPSTALSTQQFPGAANNTTTGALGTDVLSTYGSILLDYRHAHLWFGVG